MNKICVYTCITGNYDSLRQPKVVTKDVDFICFADQQISDAGVWKVRQVPEELKWLSNVKRQRIVKNCPHRYLKEYDVSIWIDGNISIVGDLTKFIEQYDLNANPFYTRVHPSRNCIYDEAKKCIEMGKDTSSRVNKQVNKYKAEGYPKHIGMVETCILLRNHNDAKCQLICNAWATELLENSHRDQLSFNYVCWKNHFQPGIMSHEFSMYNNNYFRIYAHG